MLVTSYPSTSPYFATFQNPKEKHKVHIMRSPDTTNGKRLRVMVEHADGLSQWPMQYNDGSIAYDYPEKLTKSTRKIVERVYSELPAILKTMLLNS